MNIVASGYLAVTLIPDNDAYYSIDSFLMYMNEIAFMGKCCSDYCYVPACASKKANDILEAYFKQEYLQFRAGWTLFKNKEYLEKMENQKELKAILSDFIMRFERKPSEQPDLNRFHKFNEQGKRIGVLDMEIVDYLIQTIPFFIIGSTPYIYCHGYYQEDSNGILLKSHIQKLLFRDCIKSSTIQSIYNLLVSQPQIQKKFLMIKGKGGTGKSVAIALIQHIVGIENCSSISLQDLNKRFYATGLFGKQLNACADIPCTAMQSVDIIKKAVGEDTLLYEKKGQDPTQFHSYAKLLFSANEMPLNLDDKTNAYYRRLLVLDMNRLVSASEKDTMLKEKIYKEADYAIHMGIAALKQLYADNHFCESLHSRECIEALYRSADSVKAFLDEKICRQKGAKLRRSELYQLYTKFCEENDRQAHGKSVFFRMMSDKGYTLKRDCNGFYYDNLSLKDEDFVKV
ncbi:MAG: phage/plasmid primase, P4 family, partial [Eubacteriales bacterium]|nr:phage/plasmid primase, P4 family [Eubacteriales bacterium]